MSDEPRVNDPRVLRAIAHPTRNRILSELGASGPARAADLARELGIPANQASFHLRQLAKYGLVEEAPEEARDRRDRVWRAAAAHGFTIDLNAIGETDSGAGAVSVFKDQLRNWGAYLISEALDEPEDEAGSDRRQIMESAIRLNEEERKQFQTEVTELFDRWSDRTRNRSIPRDTYSLFFVFQPYPRLPDTTSPTD